LEVKNRALDSYLQAGATSVKEASIITGVDIVAGFALFFAFGLRFFDVLGFVLLMEAAVIMLVGGALGVAGQPGLRSLGRLWSGAFRRRREEDGVKAKGKFDTLDDPKGTRLNDIGAAMYMLTGVILFLESMALAFVVQ
jgi:hypothetical protein